MSNYVSQYSGVQIDTALSVIIVSGLTAPAAAYITSVIIGTAVASKAVVLDANKDFAGVRYLSVDRLAASKGIVFESLSAKPVENPAAGRIQLYSKSGGLFYMNSSGVEYPLGGNIGFKILEYIPSGVTYYPGEQCYYNLVLYLCVTQTSGAFDTNDWQAFLAPEYEYSNSTPMPVSVGGLEAGTTFSSLTMTSLLNNLLYPYQYPSFTAFSISGQSTTLECGEEIAAGAHTFVWSVSNGANVQSNSIAIRDVSAGADLANSLANDGTESVNTGVAITKIVTGQTQQWSVRGTDSNADPISARTFTVVWYSPFYYGVGAVGLSVAQVQGLTKQIVATGNKTYTFSPSNQVYYCAYPASYGVLTSILDTNGFEVIGDFTLRVVSFTNNSPNYKGGTVSYNVYEFNNLTTQTNFNITFKF